MHIVLHQLLLESDLKDSSSVIDEKSSMRVTALGRNVKQNHFPKRVFLIKLEDKGLFLWCATGKR